MLQFHPNPMNSVSVLPGRISHNCTLKESVAGTLLSFLFKLYHCAARKTEDPRPEGTFVQILSTRSSAREQGN